MKPSISIIIPAYNAEINIRRCLNSLLEQTEKNYEVVIVNDGSSDNTGKIAEEYKNKDQRFKIIHTCNRGVSNARNTGLKNAEGKFITFLDSDDCLEPNYIEELVNTDENYDIVCTSMRCIDEDSGKLYFENKYRATSINLNENNSLDYIMSLGGLEYACSKRYSKATLDLYNIIFDTNHSIGEDTLFFSEYLIHSSSIYFTNKTAYIYYKSNKGASSIDINFFEKIAFANKAILKTLSKRYKSVKNSITWKKRSINLQLAFLNYASNTNEYSLTDKQSLICRFIKNNPANIDIPIDCFTVKESLLYFLLKYKYVRSAILCSRMIAFLHSLKNILRIICKR